MSAGPFSGAVNEGTPDGSLWSDEPCAAYTRFSSDLQDPSSTRDQLRKCQAHAARDGKAIRPDLVFSDEAVSGAKAQRRGLDAMLDAARAGRFKVLYIENLSRLARDLLIAMKILRELAYLGIRVVIVDEGIDTDQPAWDVLATVLSLHHERFLKDLGNYVFRGQEGNLSAGFSNGDYCFGYTSEPVPGSEKTRRGRDKRPRKRDKIDLKTSPWVERIFRWFVEERRSRRWIARELTRLGAPKDHRSTTPAWSAHGVTTVLGNPKYVGFWPWGKRKRKRHPLTGALAEELRDPDEWKKWLRHRPDLRILPDDKLWKAAQELLSEAQTKTRASRRRGRWHGASADRGAYPRHLLQGLLRCAGCGGTFITGGGGAGYLGCPNTVKGLCSCHKMLRRDLAERLILREVSKRILADPQWRHKVLSDLLAHHRALETQQPHERQLVEDSLAAAEKKIARLLDDLEDGAAPPDVRRLVKDRLEQRLAEKEAALAKLKELEQIEGHRLPMPTEEWVRSKLEHLENLLRAGNPAAALALRDLVGGQILLSVVPRQGYHRDFLRGSFVLDIRNVVTSMGVDRASASPGGGEPDSGLAADVVIDFVDDHPYEALSDRIKELWDAGLRYHQIATEAGCHVKKVTKILKYWHDQRGLRLPDGRRFRKGRWLPKAVVPEPAEWVEQAKALWDQGLASWKIARKLKCGQKRVDAALRRWFQERGLTKPDRRNWPRGRRT